MQTTVKKISILTVTLVASLGGFLFGFDMAVISGVLPLVQKQFNLSAFQEGWFVSSALVGCIVGVAFSGELTDMVRIAALVTLAVLTLGSNAFGSSAWAQAASQSSYGKAERR